MPRFLADATFWVAVVCSVVAQLAIVRAAWITHAGSARGADGAGGVHGEMTTRRGREVTWAVVPGIALGLVLYFTWRAVHPLPPHDGAAGNRTSSIGSSVGGASASAAARYAGARA